MRYYPFYYLKIALAICVMGFSLKVSANPVSMIVPYPPGGSADVMARLIAAEYSERTGTTMIIENKPGAGATIGARYVANAKPDGKTLLFGTVTSQVMAPAMNPNVSYDPVTDFMPVSFVASMPFLLISTPDKNIGALADMSSLSTPDRDAMRYSSAGIGTSNHLAALLFEKEANMRLEHIPYRGSAPALLALLTGEVDLMFDLIATTLPYLESGEVRPIAISSTERSRFAPDVPTLQELGVDGFDVTAWFGIFAPAKTDDSVIEQLNTELATVLGSETIRNRFLELGIEPSAMAFPEFSEFVHDENQKWTSLIGVSQIALQQD